MNHFSSVADFWPLSQVHPDENNSVPVQYVKLTALKGTEARDFLASVFFMDLPYMGPRFRGFFVFAKLFKYLDESAL
jgi:hypothetical protein